MEKVIFVDTSAWYAMLDNSSTEHVPAAIYASDNAQRFVTSDYVFSETLTLLRARGHDPLAFEFGQHMLTGDETKLLWVEHADVEQAWILFRYRGKQWSFVDCVSFALMKRLGIKQAFSFDKHFREFGAVSVDPN